MTITRVAAWPAERTKKKSTSANPFRIPVSDGNAPDANTDGNAPDANTDGNAPDAHSDGNAPDANKDENAQRTEANKDEVFETSPGDVEKGEATPYVFYVVMNFIPGGTLEDDEPYFRS